MDVIDQRRRDLGGFEVGRVLPFTRRHMVGPFIFFDHIGPVNFAAGIPRSVLETKTLPRTGGPGRGSLKSIPSSLRA